MTHPKKEFMKAAIEEALKAKGKGDHAVGAVVVKNDKIVARGGERIKFDNDPTQHAEVVAIREASKASGSRHLEDCILYTTHEPCPMCASAAIWARMEGIVSGAKMSDMIDYKVKKGNKDCTWRTVDIPASLVLKKGDPKLFLIEGFMREKCKKLLHY